MFLRQNCLCLCWFQQSARVPGELTWVHTICGESPKTFPQGEIMHSRPALVVVIIPKCTSATTTKELGKNKFYYSHVLGGHTAHQQRERKLRPGVLSLLGSRVACLGFLGFPLYWWILTYEWVLKSENEKWAHSRGSVLWVTQCLLKETSWMGYSLSSCIAGNIFELDVFEMGASAIKSLMSCIYIRNRKVNFQAFRLHYT